MKRMIVLLLVVALFVPVLASASPAPAPNPSGERDYENKKPWHRPDHDRRHDWRWRRLPIVIVQSPPPVEEKPVYGRAGNGQVIWSTEKLYQANVNNTSIDFRLFGDGEKSVFLLSFEMNDAGNQTMYLRDVRAHSEVKPVYTQEALNFLKALGVDTVVTSTKAGTQATYTMAELEAALSGTDG